MLYSGLVYPCCKDMTFLRSLLYVLSVQRCPPTLAGLNLIVFWPWWASSGTVWLAVPEPCLVDYPLHWQVSVQLKLKGTFCCFLELLVSLANSGSLFWKFQLFCPPPTLISSFSTLQDPGALLGTPCPWYGMYLRQKARVFTTPLICSSRVLLIVCNTWQAIFSLYFVQFFLFHFVQDSEPCPRLLCPGQKQKSHWKNDYIKETHEH